MTDEYPPELEVLLENAKEVIATLEQMKSEAKNSAQMAETSSAETQSFNSGAKTALNEVDAALAQVKTSRDEVLAYLEKTKTDSALTAEIARIADEKDTRVENYETELKELHEKFTELESNLKDLLPAATGVGLAKSFNTRRKALEKSVRNYLILYILSIVGFIVLGVFALTSDSINSLSDFLTFTLERSPIIVGLILIEELSRRQFRSTVRLEEDYAYKETISIAYEGYKKAMQDVDGISTDSLATILGKNVLSVLNQRPGELIDIERENKIPSDQLLNILMSSGQNEQSANVFSELLRSLKINWLKTSAIIIVTLLIGGIIGFYISSYNSSKLDVNMQLNSTNTKHETKP
jgi:uncharacterized protein YneF (UPF0154 family)